MTGSGIVARVLLMHVTAAVVTGVAATGVPLLML